MADFAPARPALWFRFAHREGREVVVQDEFFVVRAQGDVHHHLVVLSAEGQGSQRLGFAAGEERRAVGRRQVVHFAPDRADLIKLAPIEADALCHDHLADDFFFEFVEVFFDLSRFFLHVFFAFLLGQLFNQLIFDSGEAFSTQLFVEEAAGNLINPLFGEEFDFLFEFGIFDYRLDFTFFQRFLSHLFGQLQLGVALHLDGFVAHFDGIDQRFFRAFLGFTFNHDHVVESSSDNDV